MNFKLDFTIFKDIYKSEKTLIFISFILAATASVFSIYNQYNIAYGDAESHLNIAKRVLSSPTPGFSQLGGIWLPLPHILLMPFVIPDFMWRSGIAGAIVSGFFYIISSVFIYKLVMLLTKNRNAAFVGFLTFALNPNILYMQTTPMTELPLIGFFVLSTYFFIKFLEVGNLNNLIFAGFLTFAASMTRYDGWFLVLIEELILISIFIFKKGKRKQWLSNIILFTTPAIFGILLWFLWDFLILGDALYFSNSPFSAKAQQQGWLARGELPAYKNVFMSFAYYIYTSGLNVGIIIGFLAILGALVFIFKNFRKWYVLLITLVPFIFYVATLYVGQSVIFVPPLTPANFEWKLFNARYGIMMIPTASLFVATLFSQTNKIIKLTILLLIFANLFLFTKGEEKIITLTDGISGLSASKFPDAQRWLAKNYDDGYVLLDDYARTISIIRTDIPINKVIYIGNKPQWQNSLKNPQLYDKWIVMQKDDAIWKNFMGSTQKTNQLYKYYNKVYTSPQILIFKRIQS